MEDVLQAPYLWIGKLIQEIVDRLKIEPSVRLIYQAVMMVSADVPDKTGSVSTFANYKDGCIEIDVYQGNLRQRIQLVPGEGINLEAFRSGLETLFKKKMNIPIRGHRRFYEYSPTPHQDDPGKSHDIMEAVSLTPGAAQVYAFLLGQDHMLVREFLVQQAPQMLDDTFANTWQKYYSELTAHSMVRRANSDSTSYEVRRVRYRVILSAPQIQQSAPPAPAPTPVAGGTRLQRRTFSSEGESAAVASTPLPIQPAPSLDPVSVPDDEDLPEGGDTVPGQPKGPFTLTRIAIRVLKTLTANRRGNPVIVEKHSSFLDEKIGKGSWFPGYQILRDFGIVIPGGRGQPLTVFKIPDDQIIERHGRWHDHTSTSGKKQVTAPAAADKPAPAPVPQPVPEAPSVGIKINDPTMALMGGNGSSGEAVQFFRDVAGSIANILAAAELLRQSGISATRQPDGKMIIEIDAPSE